MTPIDYSLDVQSPFQAALQGYQAGATIRQGMLEQQQQEAKLKAAQEQQLVIRNLIANKNPTAADYAAATLAVPGYKEQLDQAWKMRSTEQQQNLVADTGQIYAALSNGKADVAADILNKKADALEASGASPQEVESNRTLAKLALEQPDFARTKAGMLLMTLPGGDKVIENMSKFNADQRAGELQPSVVAKAEAEASSAATTAKFAESKAVMDLKMSAEQIKKWAADTDIARQNSRIAAMNASIAREGNAIKLEELRLKRDEALQARDDKLRGKVADVEAARGTMDNFLNTADRLLNVAVEKGSDGKPRTGKDGRPIPSSTLRAAAGPIDSRLPTMQGDVADLEALAETLGSQAFLSQLPAMKGTGNLSEKEGDKLQASLTNLSLKQRPEQLLENIKEAQRLILKARGNLATRYGVPDTIPDTPAVNPSGAEVDDLVRKYTGGR